MATYLRCYRTSGRRFNRPLVPGLTVNRIIERSRVLSSFVALSVLVLECVVVPGSMFLQPSRRPSVAYVMIAMHIGIALVLSLKVGVVFWTSIPCYLYGFSCPAGFGSEQWWLAFSVAAGPTLLSWATGGFLIPEDWPFTPVGLFMWNGRAAASLANALMVEDTRMVLMTEAVASRDLTGLRVLHSGETLSKERSELNGAVVHDAVMRSIGFTLVQGGDPLVEAVQMLHRKDGLQRLVRRTWAWLQVERGRLVEIHTGCVLSDVAVVRIDRKSGRIVDVVPQ